MAKTHTPLEIGQSWSTTLASGGIAVQASKGLGKFITQLEERLRVLEGRASALENVPPGTTNNEKPAGR
jgi:hypothetical protein